MINRSLATMSKNVSHEDFYKLMQTMNELALLLHIGLHDIHQVVTIVNRDSVDPLDPRALAERI